MNFRRITPDIKSNRLQESKRFYGEFIGLKLAMEMDWILTYISDANPTAQVNILHSDVVIDNSNVFISIECSDLDRLYQKAQQEHIEITYPLTTEDWGVKRFFVKDPNGVTVIIMCHVSQPKKARELVSEWFRKWHEGDYKNLPISENFKHTSPFGTIDGKTSYIALVRDNEAKFLGYSFDIHDELYEENRACVRYSGNQGDFSLDVSEWYYIRDNLIDEIIAYYHIGDIREDRQLKQ